MLICMDYTMTVKMPFLTTIHLQQKNLALKKKRIDFFQSILQP